mmetsp:Transcript_14511/g.30442  ORF Transcript_14511/g.30442 Transcript_14511/m.30442 type:complete len:213 (+) Transcript_14511:617-1255(+)
MLPHLVPRLLWEQFLDVGAHRPAPLASFGLLMHLAAREALHQWHDACELLASTCSEHPLDLHPKEEQHVLGVLGDAFFSERAGEVLAEVLDGTRTEAAKGRRKGFLGPEGRLRQHLRLLQAAPDLGILGIQLRGAGESPLRLAEASEICQRPALPEEGLAAFLVDLECLLTTSQSPVRLCGNQWWLPQEVALRQVDQDGHGRGGNLLGNLVL